MSSKSPFTTPNISVAYRSNAGGLNSTASPTALQDNESSELLNVVFNKFGAVKKRAGYTALNTSAFNSGATWNGIYWYELNSGSQFLTGVCGNKIAKMDDLDGTWDDITQTGAVVFTGAGLNDATAGGTFTGNGDIEYKVVIDATGTPDTFEWFKDNVSQAAGVSITGGAQTLDNGLTITFAATTGHTLNNQWVFHPATTITAGNNNHVSWATNVNTMLGTNGVNRPFKWTGSGLASIMSVPAGLTTAKYVAVYQGYTLLANVTVSGVVYPNRVYWSALDSISSWDSADFRDVNTGDGQSITGLKVLGESIVVCKTRSIWTGQFTGDADIPFVFGESRSYVGAVADESIQVIDNGLMFLSSDGFYFFDGNNSFKASDRINATLDTFAKNRFSECVSSFNATLNRYITSFTTSGGSTHNRNITWDNFNNAFSLWSGVNANCFARVYVSGEERTYFGDYLGYVYRMDVGTDDYPSNVQTAITSYYYTKWFDYGDLIIKKAVPITAIYFQLTNSTMTFVYSYNFESADQYTQTFSMSAGGSLYGSGLYGTATYASSGGGVRKRHLTGRGEVIRMGFKNSTLSETFTLDGFGAYPYGETED